MGAQALERLENPDPCVVNWARQLVDGRSFRMKQMQLAGNKHTRADIKWIRLQEICRSTAGCGLTVELHASTDIPANTRAEVLKEGHRVDIVLNMLYNKTLDDVIDSLAHEMAHVVLADEGHGRRFHQKWVELRKSLTREYRALGLLAKARSLAAVHLADLEDKAGEPKLGHAERVAKKLSLTIEKTVAYLHDLLEDSGYTAEQLKRDFPLKIVAAVLAMTREDKAEPYMSYIRRLALNSLAKKVKLADLEDNLDPARPLPDKALETELRARYREAWNYLSGFKDPKKLEHS
jgi:hypothetical protein